MSLFTRPFICLERPLNSQEDQPVLKNCTIRSVGCAFIDPASIDAGKALAAMLRGVVFDVAAPQNSGRSKGWGNTSQGYEPSQGALEDIFGDGVQNLRSKTPVGGECNPGPVPPMIIVPGLISSRFES